MFMMFTLDIEDLISDNFPFLPISVWEEKDKRAVI